MNKKIHLARSLAIFLLFLLMTSQVVIALSETSEDKQFKQEVLDQLLAPIALYPDSLLAQIFMASTYPLEVVQAGRWVKVNKDLKDDAVTAALEKESWDPSVKSLVNFPQVLDFMNEKLEWTQKLGDAFLSQQKEVMDTVQTLRKKAKEQGNLENSKEQKVIVEKETQTIIIEPASIKVVYVPTYNPTVVYGPWWHPSYPPYYYYPPGYVAGRALLSFGRAVIVTSAWGYAWGGCNWRHSNIDININKNININNNINRNKYKNSNKIGQTGKGQWKHNPEHRKGVSYRDHGTARKFDRGASKNAASRDAFRGRVEKGRKNISKGDTGQFKNRSGSGNLGSKNRANTGKIDRSQARQRSNSKEINSSRTRQRTNKSAFGSNNRGSQTRSSSNRGHHSMSSRSGGRRR